MTIEEQLQELQSVVDNLKSEKESILNKNSELLSEVKKLKNASKEHNVDELLKTIEDLETKTSSYEKENKILKSDFEKTNKILSDKDAKLRQTLVSDGLTKALIEAGIDKNHLEMVKGNFERNVTLDESYNAVLDGKDLVTFAKDFLSSENGKIYAEFKPTGGGASNGSGANGGQDTPNAKAEQAKKSGDVLGFLQAHLTPSN